MLTACVPPPIQAWEAHPVLFRKALAGLVEQYVGNRTVVVNPAVDWVLAGSLGSAVRGTSTQKRWVCVGAYARVCYVW